MNNNLFKAVFSLLAVVLILTALSFKSQVRVNAGLADSLRQLYSQSPDKWPKPTVDDDVQWKELGLLPAAPVKIQDKSKAGLLALGKTLFYDPRLSGSNQISCISCHAPEMHWSDGRSVSLGHGQAANNRNSPSLENIWYFKRLFWDGRAANIAEQINGPIGSDIEMHQDIKKLPEKLSAIKGYQPLFTAAFGDKKINSDRIAEAFDTYLSSLVSRKSAFDYFLMGNKKALTDEQITGLHLFRTKARCMNCHNGPLFTDNDFHNLGLTYYGRNKYEDLGRYNITKKPEDVGKFKTPGLRNVLNTKPWFHNGLFTNIEGVLNMYNNGMPQPKPRPEQVNDPLFPKTDIHIKKLNLTAEERNAVIAFLNGITTEAWRISTPPMPE